MNGVLAYVNALAWPVALVVLALIFRREIGQASSRLGRVKYRDLELTFREDLRQAEALARTIPAVAAAALAPAPGQVILEGDTTPGPNLGGAMIVAAMPTDPSAKGKGKDATVAPSPREMISQAWEELVQTLIRAAARVGGRRTPAPSRADDAVLYLTGRGWLSVDESRLFAGLSKLRDQVDQLDGAVIGVEEARRFVEAAKRLTARVASKA